MTDETNTTPGPWFSQGVSDLSPGHPDYGASYIVGDQLGGLVGAALPWPSEIFEGRFDRVEANARLIAAAPELLEALIVAEAQLVYLGGFDEGEYGDSIQAAIVNTVRSAIAKADGRSK